MLAIASTTHHKSFSSNNQASSDFMKVQKLEKYSYASV